MALPRHLDFTADGWAVNEIPPAIKPFRTLVTRCRTSAYAGRITRSTSGPLQPEQTPGVTPRFASKSTFAFRRPRSAACPPKTTSSRLSPAIDRLSTTATSHLNAPQPPTPAADPSRRPSPGSDLNATTAPRAAPSDRNSNSPCTTYRPSPGSIAPCEVKPPRRREFGLPSALLAMPARTLL